MADNMLALQVQPPANIGPTLNIISEIAQRKAQTDIATVDAARKNALYNAYASQNPDAIAAAGDVGSAAKQYEFNNTKRAYDYLQSPEGAKAVRSGDFTEIFKFAPGIGKDLAGTYEAATKAAQTLTETDAKRLDLGGGFANMALQTSVPAERSNVFDKAVAAGVLAPREAAYLKTLPPEDQNKFLLSIAAGSKVAVDKATERNFGTTPIAEDRPEIVGPGLANIIQGGALPGQPAPVPGAAPVPAAQPGPANGAASGVLPPQIAPAPTPATVPSAGGPVPVPNMMSSFAGAPPVLPVPAGPPPAAAAPAPATPAPAAGPATLAGVPITPLPGGGLVTGATPESYAASKGVGEASAALSKSAAEDAAEAQTVRYSLGTLANNYRSFVESGGGFLSPGTGAGSRVGIAKLVNSAAEAAGIKPLFDPKAVASAEAATKESTRLGFDLARTLGAREAMQIVQQAIGVTPSIENTPQGFKRIMAALDMAQQRAIDRNEFIQGFKGSKQQADIAFNKANPPEKYAMRAAESTIPPAAVANLRAKRDGAVFDEFYGVPGLADFILKGGK